MNGGITLIVLTVKLIIAGIIFNVLPLYYDFRLKRAVKRNGMTETATIPGKDLYREKQALQDKLHYIELQFMRKELTENQYF